jgi:hypothetical protein
MFCEFGGGAAMIQREVDDLEEYISPRGLANRDL